MQLLKKNLFFLILTTKNLTTSKLKTEKYGSKSKMYKARVLINTVTFKIILHLANTTKTSCAKF